MAGPSSQSPLMQFGMRQNENSFKISLKSPNTLKSMGQNGSNGTANSSHGNGSSGGAGPMGVAPNVSSTNPKTPSPSTNDVSVA